MSELLVFPKISEKTTNIKIIIDMNVAHFLEKTAQKYPRKNILIFDDTKFSYMEFERRVNQLAHALCSQYDIAAGSHVAVLLNNCPEYIFTVYALLKIGAPIIPINRFLTCHEIQHIVNNGNVIAVITSDEFSEHFSHLRTECPALRHIIDGDRLSKQSADCSDSFSAVDLNDDALAVIIYTSGTTGKPKGAMLSHKNLCSNAQTCVDMIKVTKRDRLLLILPMFHSFTFTVCMVMPIVKGASIIALRSVQPFTRVIRSVLKNRVSIFIGIPKIYDLLSEKKIPFWMRWIWNIRLFISGSAPLSVTTLERFNKNIGIPLLEGYGLSEASPVVALNPMDGERKPGSIGLPINGVEVKIVDDSISEVPVDCVGELAVRGDNVMLGYYKNPDATAETIRNGWLLTGDMAKKDKDGYLYIVDRKKDMVLVQGMNVYPREIEEVLHTHTSVAETAVIGINDPRKGEMVIAYVTLRESAQATSKELITFCRERLAAYKCPRKILFVDELPRSSIGKVLKRVLREEIV